MSLCIYAFSSVFPTHTDSDLGEAVFIIVLFAMYFALIYVFDKLYHRADERMPVKEAMVGEWRVGVRDPGPGGVTSRANCIITLSRRSGRLQIEGKWQVAPAPGANTAAAADDDDPTDWCVSNIALTMRQTSFVIQGVGANYRLFVELDLPDDSVTNRYSGRWYRIEGAGSGLVLFKRQVGPKGPVATPDPVAVAAGP